MKKIFSILILILLISLLLITIILSTIGIETKQFNNLITQKINSSNKNVSLNINLIKFKLDLKEISLFLEKNNSQINYREAIIPTKNIKVYIDFISLLKFDAQIKKINLILKEIEVAELKKISTNFKPSNFTSFINNRIKTGNINSEIEIFLDNDNLLDNFIARGSVKNLEAKIDERFNFGDASFDFFADKSDILIKKVYGKTALFKIEKGDLKISLSPEIILESNFLTNIKYKKDPKNSLDISNIPFLGNFLNLDAELKNYFFVNFDKTYKVKNYDYKLDGKIIEGNIKLNKPLKNNLLDEEIKEFYILNSEINTKFNQKKKNITILGDYSFNNDNFLKYKFSNIIEKSLINLKLDLEYDKEIDLSPINYKKPKGIKAQIAINFDKDKDKDNYNINKISLNEGKTSILIKGIKLKKEKILSLKEIFVKTFSDGSINNDFKILYTKDKIIVEGKEFDATNIPKLFNQKRKNNRFSNINKEVEINLSEINAPLSEKLKDFKLIGTIKNVKFIKINSKGDFGKNNFLDITMKNDENNNKKFLEVYSDLTKPLLTEFSFFKGLTGGKLLYSSIYDSDSSSSKLKIENFKVVNAPGMIKLLSLADLGGLADLAEGEGISFEILEISMEKEREILKLNEILALGPSISVLMEGYQDSNVTSLRGTLVPAKTLNRMISKIPVLGDIIIPKEVGEGLFGISFKMKGPPGKIKTTINPIRTITPRFIQKIIDRKKIIK